MALPPISTAEAWEAELEHVGNPFAVPGGLEWYKIK